MSDKLKLRGTQEAEARFPHLGKRFIPKNVGTRWSPAAWRSLVSVLKRSTAWWLITSCRCRACRWMSIPITFLINPAYTMSGSLDGMTGSSATSDRFFRHVPEMRSQYGSLYPASYYRLQEAYALKLEIEQQDKEHAAYFEQFDATQVGEAALSRQERDAKDAIVVELSKKISGERRRHQAQ